MTDNSIIPVATGNETFANHDIGGIKYPRVRITWGATGATNDADIAAGKGLPIQGSVSITGTPTVSGTVAISAEIPGTGATNLGKAIDTAAGSTDTGVGALGVRADTLVTLTPAAGDWVPFRTDSKGAIWMRLINEQVEAGEYKDVAASQPSTVLGTTGAAGDFLSSIIFFPESLNPGAVTLQDGALTAITVFFGGTASVSNLVPFEVAFGHASVNGAWKVVTGAAIHIRGVGNFT